jgi:hypothetical protein
MTSQGKHFLELLIRKIGTKVALLVRNLVVEGEVSQVQEQGIIILCCAATVSGLSTRFLHLEVHISDVRGVFYNPIIPGRASHKKALKPRKK